MARLRITRVLAALVLATAGGCGYNPALTAVRASDWIAPSKSGLRTVPTAVVIDPFWYVDDDGPLAVMERVSAEWEHDFGIRFAVTEVVWDRVTGFNLVYKLARLRQRYPATPARELVVLFTGSTGLLMLEVTEVLGNHVVIGPGFLEATGPVVHHGLGHIFGAPHSLLPGNYMSAWAFPVITTQTSFLGKFSDAAREAISENKWRSFGVESKLFVGDDGTEANAVASGVPPHAGAD